MKKLLFLVCSILLAFSFTAFAESKGTGNEMVGQGEQTMEQNISPCMVKMHNMIENMNKVLKKDIKSDDRTKIADIMEEMSKNLMDMSHMMKKGYCTIEELDKLNKDVSDTEKRFDELDSYL